MELALIPSSHKLCWEMSIDVFTFQYISILLYESDLQRFLQTFKIPIMLMHFQGHFYFSSTREVEEFPSSLSK